MKYPNSLQTLIECYKDLPGIGEKNAERLAFATLKFDEEQIEAFSNSIKEVKTKIKKCSICNNLTEEDLCDICKDKNRNSDVLCVVENTKNLILFEKANIFNGKYHVLEGLIKEEKIKEVILALTPNIEGETTSAYILKLLEGLDVKVTKIAAGIPVGADMEYLDPLTIARAMEGRNMIS